MTSTVHDQQLATRARTFIERYCTHARGSRIGQPFLLAPWQADLVSNLFGCLTAQGTRKHKFVWLEAPRKSGKSTLAASLMLYMLLVDEEQGAEIVICSSSSASASICLNIAKSMVQNNADMSSVCSVRSRTISYKNNHIQMVSTLGRSLGGMDISMVVVDDVQGMSQHDVHDALKCCTAARRSPIILYLASAGSDKLSPGWSLHRYAERVAAGDIDDPAWLVRIFAARAEDDWTDPTVWRRSHPGLGTTISEAFFREECSRALAAPGNVDAFRRSFLNVWTDRSSRWIDMEQWDRCERSIDWAHYRQRPCRIGVDLSATMDLTAVVVAFMEADGGYTLLPFAFCPEETVDRRSRRDGIDYREWVDGGLLTATHGNTVDYTAVQEKIVELCGQYSVLEVAYDKWCASMLVAGLLERGVPCAPVKQDAPSLNAAVREFETVIHDRRLRHDGNPVMRWCTANASVQANPAGELRPTKRRSRDRIDVAVASLFAISGYLRQTTDDRHTRQ